MSRSGIVRAAVRVGSLRRWPWHGLPPTATEPGHGDREATLRQDPNPSFSCAITTVRDPILETGCVVAWALDYARQGDPRVEILASPESSHMPNEDQIIVWVGTAVSDIDTMRRATAPLLSTADQLAAMLPRDPADQRASLAAHAGARLMLGKALGVAPSSVRIHRGEQGKPLLEDPGLHFSLAHVRGAVAVALARRPVGIDIERKAALPDLLAVAAIAFAPESRKALDAVEGEARTEMFYRFWTLGEAFIKATGLGVSQGLDSFCFTEDGQPRLTRVTPGWGLPERWRFGFR
jgi:4'-phosphopantetheinyl transferase